VHLSREGRMVAPFSDADRRSLSDSSKAVVTIALSSGNDAEIQKWQERRRQVTAARATRQEARGRGKVSAPIT
jgi:hypothetical protein